jgi:hypothetical protein
MQLTTTKLRVSDAYGMQALVINTAAHSDMKLRCVRLALSCLRDVMLMSHLNPLGDNDLPACELRVHGGYLDACQAGHVLLECHCVVSL